MSPFNWQEHVESVVDLGRPADVDDPHAHKPSDAGLTDEELVAAWPLIRFMALDAGIHQHIVCLPWATPTGEARIDLMRSNGQWQQFHQLLWDAGDLVNYLDHHAKAPEKSLAFKDCGIPTDQFQVLVDEAKKVVTNSPELLRKLKALDVGMHTRSVVSAVHCLSAMARFAGVSPPGSAFGVAWAYRDVAAAANGILEGDETTRGIFSRFLGEKSADAILHWTHDLAEGDAAFRDLAKTIVYCDPRRLDYAARERPEETVHPLVHNWITMELLALTMPPDYREEVEATCRELFARGAKPAVYAQLMKVMPECAPAPAPLADEKPQPARSAGPRPH